MVNFINTMQNEQQETPRKLKANEWLESDAFIAKMDYPNKDFVKSLTRVIASFVWEAPVPILTTWDPLHKRIYFSIGTDKRYFELDENVDNYDYIVNVSRWAYKYFPYYELDEEKEVELSDDEILAKVQKGVNLDDAILLRKKIQIKERGTLVKVDLGNDQFVLDINGDGFVRISGTLNNPKTLSIFLKELRLIQDNKERKNFIFQNSVELKKLPEKPIIKIAHQKNKMINFFIIHYPDLKHEPIIKNEETLNNLEYKWGRFLIRFEDNELRDYCMNYITTRIKDDEIKDWLKTPVGN
jgi:hypothetical protein